MTLEYHPFANIFPLIEGADFDALVADIKANGLAEPIDTFEGMILDGRNRFRACSAACVMPKFLPFQGTTDAALRWVVSKNIKRRHLNDDQRRMVAARLVTVRQGRPETNPAECGIKVADAARMVNVDEAGTERARTVQANATPEIAQAVDRGKLSVNSANQASKLSQEQQREIAKDAEAGKANVVRTVIKKGVRAVREAVLGKKQLAWPDKKYGVILADPEWKFVVFSETTGLDRSPDQHYPTSSEKQIAARNVQKIAAKDCLLLLWTTDLARGIRVMESWGFAYKSYVVWVKDIVRSTETEDMRRMAGLGSGKAFLQVGPAGTGYWNRDRDEICLIGTRGNIPCPAMGDQDESVEFAARPKDPAGKDRGEHSAKPPFLHYWVEKHYPTLPRIELNARTRRYGWDAWGLEADA